MATHIRRREFIVTLGGAAVAWSLTARAQQSAMPVMRFLHVASHEAYSHVVAGLRRGLAETDFVEGRNVAVEYRCGEGQLDRMPSLLADLLDHQVSVIVANLAPEFSVICSKRLCVTSAISPTAARKELNDGRKRELP